MENASSLIQPRFNFSEPSHETFLSEDEKAVLTVILSLLGLFGFLGNGIVIYTVISFGNYVDVPENIFILSQAFADLGTVISIPIFTFHMYSWIWELVYIYASFVWLASLGSLLLLTLNRLISVVYPLRYIRKMTPCRAKCLVVAIWMAALSDSLWNLYGYLASGRHYFEIERYYIVVLLIFVLFSNAYMFRESRIQARKINRQGSVLTGLQKNLREDFKSVKTLSLVGGTFLLSCLPYIVVAFMYGEDKISVQFQRNAVFCAPLIVINAVLDPLIYYFRSSEFRSFYQRFRRLHLPPRKLDSKMPFTIFNKNKRTQVNFSG